MAEKLFDTSVFADLATPEQAARALRELYGAGAYDAADRCAGAAMTDGRYRDYRLWSACREIIENADSHADAHTDNRPGRPPTGDELLRLVRQFVRIGDKTTRDFAIDRIKDIADGRLVPLRPNRGG